MPEMQQTPTRAEVMPRTKPVFLARKSNLSSAAHQEMLQLKMNLPYKYFAVFYFSEFPSSNHPFKYFCLLRAVKIKSHIRNILELIFLRCWEDTETEFLC